MQREVIDGDRECEQTQEESSMRISPYADGFKSNHENGQILT